MEVVRDLYVVLVKDPSRDPSECLHIIGLWLWLSSATIMENILTLPLFLIKELVDEAVKCLRCIDPQLPEPRLRYYRDRSETQLTRDLLNGDISLRYLRVKRSTAFLEVQNIVSSVCIPTLADLFERARQGDFRDSPAPSLMMPPERPECRVREGMIPGWNDAMERTLFITFTRGVRVRELDVVGFVERTFLGRVEMAFLQRVSHGEQPLYARVLFGVPVSLLYMQGVIINVESINVEGVKMARYSMNGKDVWVYKCVET